jgi:transposase InsO family protein
MALILTDPDQFRRVGMVNCCKILVPYRQVRRATRIWRYEMKCSGSRWNLPGTVVAGLRAELQRRGQKVNRTRVQRLMREDNLLCLRKRKFMITTDSNHDLPVYRNLASTPALTGLDQLWVADITYIRLELEFVYLAVMLDAFSRREIGWALERTLEASLAIEALQMALRRRRPAPGLVHHSDQGVQYASTDYTNLLKASGITISMSQPSTAASANDRNPPG